MDKSVRRQNQSRNRCYSQKSYPNSLRNSKASSQNYYHAAYSVLSLASFEPALELGLGLEPEPEPAAVIVAADSAVAVGVAAVAAAGLAAELVAARPDWEVAAAVSFAVVASALVVEGWVENLADQGLAIELWMDLVVLAVVDSDLPDLQLAPLPSADATPAAGPAVVVELAAAAVEPAAAAAAVVVVAELAGLAGLAAAPVVLLELVDVVLSFGLVPVQLEQLEQQPAVPVENAVDEEAKGHHVM